MKWQTSVASQPIKISLLDHSESALNLKFQASTRESMGIDIYGMDKTPYYVYMQKCKPIPTLLTKKSVKSRERDLERNARSLHPENS